MVLPDVLEPGLKVVFCGSAVGSVSARRGAYYAHPGNQFWRVLHLLGLTPRQLRPEEYVTLPEYGIGLTDVVKEVSGRDIDIPHGEMASSRGRLALQAKIERFRPRALAFNGKKAAKVFLDSPYPSYGRQPERLRSSEIFVLPSTSGAARGFWDLTYWIELAHFVGKWPAPSSGV
jgi:TDG/mug DNA glycosylase family protein